MKTTRVVFPQGRAFVHLPSVVNFITRFFLLAHKTNFVEHTDVAVYGDDLTRVPVGKGGAGQLSLEVSVSVSRENRVFMAAPVYL